MPVGPRWKSRVPGSTPTTPLACGAQSEGIKFLACSRANGSSNLYLNENRDTKAPPGQTRSCVRSAVQWRRPTRGRRQARAPPPSAKIGGGSTREGCF